MGEGRSTGQQAGEREEEEEGEADGLAAFLRRRGSSSLVVAPLAAAQGWPAAAVARLRPRLVPVPRIQAAWLRRRHELSRRLPASSASSRPTLEAATAAQSLPSSPAVKAASHRRAPLVMREPERPLLG